MSMERLEQQLQTLPQWPQLREGLTSSTDDYGLWEEFTRLIIEIETTEDPLDWEGMLAPDERRFEESAKQAYLRAVLLPLARQRLDLMEYVERYCMMEWLDQQPPTVCFAMAQTIMLESYAFDDDEAQEAQEEGYMLLNMSDVADRFLVIPALPDLRNLEIYSEQDEAQIVRLLRESQLTNLKSLVISCPIAGDVLRELLEALNVEQLESLSLRLVDLTEGNWRTPNATRPMQNLNGLYLSLYHVQEEPLRQLLSQTCFEHVSMLHIMVENQALDTTSTRTIPPPNILNILGQPLTCAPQTVQVEYHPVLTAKQPLTPVSQSNAMANIRSWTTSGWVVDAEAIDAIVTHATSLTALNLLNAAITDKQLTPLLKATTLEVLVLDNNLIGPEGAHQLASSDLMETLDYCSINHNMISVQGKPQLMSVYGKSYQNDESQAFGELRSLLQEGPSQENWSTLCERLNTWQDTPYLREVVLPYLLDHLEHWPDELRVLPTQWSMQLSNGYTVPCLPIVRGVTLGYYDYTSNREMLGHELAQVIDQLEHLKHLYVDYAAPEALLNILASSVAKHLETFEMTQELYAVETSPEPSDSLSAVVEHLTQLPALKTLHLNGQYILPEHLDTLSKSGLLSQLETLKLEHNTLMQIQRLHTEQTPLNSFSLSGSYLEEANIQAFFHGHLFANLTQLDLSMVYCEQMAALVDALAENPRLNKLKTLWMAGVAQEEDHNMARLFRANGFPNLTELDLSDQSLELNVIEALISSGVFAQLKTLRVNWSNLLADAFLALSQSEGQLEHLAWAGNQIDERGLKQMVDAPWASTIKVLDFSECQSITTVDMLEPILMADTFTNLESLILYNDMLDANELQKLDRAAMHPAAQRLFDDYLSVTPWSGDDDYMDDYE